MTTLFSSGISGLLETVRDDFGPVPDGAYLSKCHLCLEIRKYLVGESSLNSDELKPVGFYENLKADFTKT